MRKQQKILLVRRSIFVLLILLAHLLQNTPGWFPAFFGIRVYFLLTFTVCLGLFEREIAGAMFGLVAGALWDSVSPLGDGYHAFLFLIIGAVCGILINTVMRNNLITALLLILGRMCCTPCCMRCCLFWHRALTAQGGCFCGIFCRLRLRRCCSPRLCIWRCGL